jgi:coenzyme F420 hydrogenase subunit beta
VGPYLNYHSARRKPNDVKGAFQYGGVVSALMLYAIDAGMIDRAVVTKNVSNLPVPVIVRSHQQILNAAGSKFALSPTNKTVNKALRILSRRLGVVSLPCQSTGIRKRQLFPRDDGVAEGEIAVNIGLFCTWAMSQKGWRSLINETIGTAKVTRIDLPPPPANMMEVSTKKGVFNIPVGEAKQCVLPGCKVCLDMTAENADISVGMVEGRDGYNTVIVRSDAGRHLLEEAVKAGYIEVGILEQSRWRHLNEASIAKKDRAIVEAENRGGHLPFYRRIIEFKKTISSYDASAILSSPPL